MRFQACGLTFLATQAFIISEGVHTGSFLQPDAASRLFHQVAGKWEEEAKTALEDSKADAEQLGHMQSACIKVANAFVAAANGDRNKAIEYMDNVCYKTDDSICKEFGRRLADQVQASTDQGNMEKFCEAFWHGPLKDKAMGKSLEAPSSTNQDSSSPLKALPRYSQGASKPSEHGSSKTDGQELHEAAAKIAAEAASKKSSAHHKSKAPVAAHKHPKNVSKPDGEVAEKRIANATAAALKAAQAKLPQAKFRGENSTKENKKAQNVKPAGISKTTRKAAKKPKALVTSGSTTGTLVADADLEHAERAAELQAQKTAAATAAAARAATEDAAKASVSNGADVNKVKTDAELERVAEQAEAEAQSTAKAAATAKQAAAEEAAVYSTGVHA
jgi:hypothetical protein